jgi:DNA-binding MarR family transcriptional regulator
MDETLLRDLQNTFFRLRRLKGPAPRAPDGARIDISFIEAILLRKIRDGRINSFSDLEEHFHVSKPAVCQMLGGLERKGYITRDMDTANRRKRRLGLTDKGRAVVSGLKRQVDAYFTGVIRRFGEDDARRLVDLCARFVDIAEEGA